MKILKKGDEEKKYKIERANSRKKKKKYTKIKYEEKNFTSLLLMLTQYTVCIYIRISICMYAQLDVCVCVQSV